MKGFSYEIVRDMVKTRVCMCVKHSLLSRSINYSGVRLAICNNYNQ